MSLDFSSRCAIAGLQLGKTKVFLRREAFDRVEALRSRKFGRSATAIQKIVRGVQARAYCRQLFHRYNPSDEQSVENSSRLVDNSVLRRIDVNVDIFESKSPRDRGNSFASSDQPAEYDWISIGHGRFVKRESFMSSQSSTKSSLTYKQILDSYKQ